MSDFLFHKKITEIVRNDEALVELIGKRVYASEAKNISSEESYIVFDQISHGDERTHDGDTMTPTSVIEYKIYATSNRLRVLISDALYLALSGSEKTHFESFYMSAVEREYSYDSPEKVTREKGGARILFRRLVNYRFRWQDVTSTT